MIFESEMSFFDVVLPDTDVFFYVNKRKYLSRFTDVLVYVDTRFNNYVNIRTESPRVIQK